ncbi:MAG TPA: beta-L-arabinofuranosidase domain-containing protein [Cyclobacteriaceae bacterium]|nr:beta-L-arabinofuranosidase domain-containing protein [Cyclobacteriaceae bacterium]
MTNRIKTFPAFKVILLIFTGLNIVPGCDQKVSGPTLTNGQEIIISGYLGDRIDQCIQKRIKAQDMDEFIDPFLHRTETRYWQTEFWGKWFTSAVAAYEYSGDEELKQKIDTAFKKLIATQTADGYIGNYADTAHLAHWDIWGRKYTLLGLISYHKLTGDTESLEAVKKLLDFTMSEVGPGMADINLTGNYRGMPSSSILEPVVLLYNITQEKKYLDFARYIVENWESPAGPKLVSNAINEVPVAERFPVNNPDQWWSWHNGQKAYEMMSCYEGLIEFYRATGEEIYLQAVEAAVKNIIDTEINICGSGASVECWYHGKKNQANQAMQTMETCVTMTWMKFLLNLYKTTDKTEYIDQFEISLYNALLSSIHPNGHTFAKYTPLCGFREEGDPQPGMKYLHCCMANGPRALMLIPSAAYTNRDDLITLNLYTQSRVKMKVNDSDVVLEQTTDYPKSGKVTIQVDPSKEHAFTLKLRIPSWCREYELMVNHEAVKSIADSGYVILNRTWSAGDKVILTLDMHPRVIESPDGSGNFAAVMRGPVVLTRDNRYSPEVDTDELVRPELNREGELELIEAPDQKGTWMLFNAKFTVGSFQEGNKGRGVTLTLCDFASAGNGWGPASRYRVWLPQVFDPRVK